MKENIKRMLEEKGAAKRLARQMAKNFGIRLSEEDWGNFVNLRGALLSMPLHDYPALYDAIYKSNSMEQMREQELPEEVKIGFTSMMIVGMENCFRLLRDMKESGQIILTDVIDEGMYRKVTLNADGTVASITSVKREEIPLAINNAEGKTDGLNGAGIEGASDL